jgi:hypothetical protein
MNICNRRATDYGTALASAEAAVAKAKAKIAMLTKTAQSGRWTSRWSAGATSSET